MTTKNMLFKTLLRELKSDFSTRTIDGDTYRRRMWGKLSIDISSPQEGAVIVASADILTPDGTVAQRVAALNVPYGINQYLDDRFAITDMYGKIHLTDIDTYLAILKLSSTCDDTLTDGVFGKHALNWLVTRAHSIPLKVAIETKADELKVKTFNVTVVGTEVSAYVNYTGKVGTAVFRIPYANFKDSVYTVLREHELTESCKKFNVIDIAYRLAALCHIPKANTISVDTEREAEYKEIIRLSNKFNHASYIYRDDSEKKEIVIYKAPPVRQDRERGVVDIEVLRIAGGEYAKLIASVRKTTALFAAFKKLVKGGQVLKYLLSQYLPGFREDGKNHPYVEALAEEEKLRDIITEKRKLGYYESAKEAERTLAFLVESRNIVLITEPPKIVLPDPNHNKGGAICVATTYPDYGDCVPVAESKKIARGLSKKVLDEIALAARMEANSPIFDEEWNNTIRYLCTVLPEVYEEPVDLQRIYDNFTQDQQILFADDLQ